MGSFKLRMHLNPFSAPAWGAYDASQTPSRLGRGTPPPHSPPPRRLVLAAIPLLLKEIYANVCGTLFYFLFNALQLLKITITSFSSLNIQTRLVMRIIIGLRLSLYTNLKITAASRDMLVARGWCWVFGPRGVQF